MKNVLLFLLLLFILPACNNKSYVYLDVEQFNITVDALKGREMIKLIYYSQGPDNNTNREYYYHFVVVPRSSNDTLIPSLQTT
ncbi:MAG: hypothetical protein ACOC31_00875 [Bacteroidota bacterium]